MPSILIVDPSYSNRLYLKLTLKKAGYDVFEAKDGEDALNQFNQFHPSLVITEIDLPLLSGQSLVTEIKSLSEETFYPIFVVTNATNPELIQEILEAGADDFLQKPYPEKLFLAKISSLLRNLDFYNDLIKSKELVSSLHSSLELEHKSAERIFEKFVHGPRKEVPGLKTHISSASIFNGDVFLSSISPAGNVVVLLGDFTGHGLPASIGAIPVAEVFYSMVRKGRTLKEIASVVNEKLLLILPVHVFFSCTVIQVSPRHKSAKVLNAGMQPLIMIDDKTREVTEYRSTCLPLGITPSESLGLVLSEVALEGHEQFILYTDGVVEAMNCDGELFGVSRLVDALLNTEGLDIQRLVTDSQNFCGSEPFMDDVSIIKLSVDDIFKAQFNEILEAVNERIPAPADWSLFYCLGIHVLKQNENPIESIIDAMMGVQSLVNFKEDFHIILSELFSNALEHGLLKLDSTIKQKENGFIDYLNEKKSSLRGLEDGEITIEIKHAPLSAMKGRVHFIVSHNGDGKVDFDLGQSVSDKVFSGRGIKIIKSLSDEFYFKQGGAQVEAIYEWECSLHAS
ncbi:fused response regulator/phosphatase [Hydrogenovibrio sp. 3SP14C1]|uniref:ATP-binding SpoIIE family protein phosphatase n=1 Tax=Hydrogenovibrio sp. 3SP14C1 TaxID=3038774 RepID=UPI0024180F9C|nr:fused response regulator/phosphatase [Hydrogenovibrio sp. 3SP14C1]MDG4812503.1 fused response regulator/phosphatase [Hydrogenovibrio sp. 3SP14C1]